MNNKILYFVIGILCILVLVLGGYVICDKLKNNKIEVNNNSEILVSKIDNNKDWVYDAEYDKNVIDDSYTTNSGVYFAKDIVAPYININSSYANISNAEIKSIFDEIVKKYNEGVSNKVTRVVDCGYKSAAYKDALSVLFTYSSSGHAAPRSVYYTYNVNLKTGNELTYKEVYDFAGFNSNNIDTKVQEAITKVMHEKLPNDYRYLDDNNFDMYNNKSIDNYKKSVSDNTIRYFLTSNGKLSVIVKLVIPSGIGEYDTIVIVE